MGGRGWRALGALFLIGSVGACASQPPPQPKEPPLFVDGVRQKPVTDEEVVQKISQQGNAFAGCYDRERINVQGGELASYVFRVHVPTDGTPIRAETVQASVASQKILEGCLTDTLQKVRFPPHVGGPIAINVPIKAPR